MDCGRRNGQKNEQKKRQKVSQKAPLYNVLGGFYTISMVADGR